MKNLIMAALFLCSATSYAATDGACKATALRIAAAVDQVYVPHPTRGTMVSSTLLSTEKGSEVWVVNYLVPNAGGQTAYEITFVSDGCSLIQLKSYSE